MRVHAIGLGGAGGRIVDRLAADHDGDRFLQGVNAFDTDAAALDALGSLEESRRYRFGDAAAGGGLDGDLHAARRLGDAHASELGRAMDAENPSFAEGFLLVVGVGGGAGAGAAPALAEELSRLYEAPVYALAILPTRGESTAAGPGDDAAAKTGATAVDANAPRRPLAEKNAARTLSALSDRCAAVFPFDNDDWLRPGESLADARDRLNGAVAERVAALFGAGESGADASTPQQVLDASDIARAVGDDGEIAALGYATQAVEPPQTKSRFGLGLFGTGDGGDAAVDTSEAVSAIETTIRKAARGKSTIDVPEGRADRTLLVVGGPPAWLNRKAIADGRRWLAEETGSDAILSGDAPAPGGTEVFAVVLRSGIDEPSRIREIRDSIA